MWGEGGKVGETSIIPGKKTGKVNLNMKNFEHN